MTRSMRIMTAGRSALLVEVDDLASAIELGESLRVWRAHGSGISSALRDVIPAARTVMVRYDPVLATREDIESALHDLPPVEDHGSDGRDVTIPVVYDGADVDAVARMWGVSADAVVGWHAARCWSAAFPGFAPGFMYLVRDGGVRRGGGARRLGNGDGGAAEGNDTAEGNGTAEEDGHDVPRRATPRLHVPAGAVGLAGRFSGVYPRDSSGGWRLIGTADAVMWDESRDPPALLRPGDRVLFTPVRGRVHVHAVTGTESGESVAMASVTAPSVTTTAVTTTAVTAPPSGVPKRMHGHPVDYGRPGPRVIIERTGMAALFEDDGRSSSDMGVTGSGAADPVALHQANDLVGNDPGTAAIEITAGGARLRAVGDVVVAVAGAKTPLSIATEDGRMLPIMDQRPVLLMDGESLVMGRPVMGWRDYIAVQGGFRVTAVVGSASRDTMSGIGPRPLAPGDAVDIARGPHTTVGEPSVWPSLPMSGRTTTLDVVLGPRDDWFSRDGIAGFLSTRWTVTPQSNRVGLRLAGGRPVGGRIDGELPSEATVPGSIEVPSDGMPVVFLRDQPVTGGYPVVAVLTEDSLRLAGQLPVGAEITFRAVGSSAGADGRIDDAAMTDRSAVAACSALASQPGKASRSDDGDGDGKDIRA